jgi:hypothetical protein
VKQVAHVWPAITATPSPIPLDPFASVKRPAHHRHKDLPYQTRKIVDYEVAATLLTRASNIKHAIKCSKFAVTSWNTPHTRSQTHFNPSYNSWDTLVRDVTTEDDGEKALASNAVAIAASVHRRMVSADGEPTSSIGMHSRNVWKRVHLAAEVRMVCAACRRLTNNDTCSESKHRLNRCTRTRSPVASKTASHRFSLESYASTTPWTQADGRASTRIMAANGNSDASCLHACQHQS